MTGGAMTDLHFSDKGDSIFKKNDFEIRELQDEIRADELCGRLLKLFHRDMMEEEGIPPAEAGTLTHGADYFLREFVIPDRRENIFAPRPSLVRQFAGNWYIVKNLEPNMAELGEMLMGIMAFYHYCEKVGLVSSEITARIQEECEQLDFYRQRIDSFWEIEGDGYFEWEKECSLKNKG
jgi:hypothetical protein